MGRSATEHVAVAISEPANLYTADRQLEPYSELVRCI